MTAARAGAPPRPAASGPPLPHFGPRVVAGDRRGARRGTAAMTLLAAAGSALAMMPLKAIFTDWAWLFETWLGLGAVALVLAALRIRRRAMLVDDAIGLLVLLGFLVAVHLSGHAWGGFIPTGATGRDLTALLNRASEVIQSSRPPVRSTPSLRLLTTAPLVGSALLIDIIAVVLRARATAGLVILALVTAGTAIGRASIGILPFIAATIGYVLILAAGTARERREWAEAAPVHGFEKGAAAVQGFTAAQMATLAMAVALIAPIFTPIAANTRLSGLFTRGGSGGGLALSPFAKLQGSLNQSDPAPLLRVNLSPRPATEPYYLRDIVLDTYSSAQGWSESDPVRDWPLADPLVREQLAGPPTGPPTGPLSGQLSGTAMSATIDVLELADSSAPTFAELTAIRGLGPSWRWDPTTATVSGGATRGASFYTVSWIQPQPTADQLRTAPPSVDPGLQRWLRLPDDVPAPVGDQARAIIAGKTTPFDEALALDQFFLDPANAFQYSTTTTTADTGDGLADFLISRRGFCQQYAAAMAVMARQVGLPTRIVLGYTHEAPGSDGTFLVTSHDAHAWVEIYFDGFGWVPFDPTPLTGADADRAVPLSYTGGPGSTDTPDGPSRTPGAATSGGPDATDVPVPDEVLSGTGPVRRAASAQSQRGPAALLVLGAALLILLAPGAARVAQRRGRARLARRTGQVWPWWEEFRAAAWDLGVTWSESATLREAPGAVAAALRAQGGAEGDLSALLELTRAAERERFGPVAAAPGGDRHAWRSTSARAAATGSAAVRNLRRSMGRPARIRARWLPASTLRPSAQRVGRAVQMMAAAPAVVLRRARRSAS